MPPKRKNATKTNSQSKLKYINTCITNLMNSLPRQTFDFLALSEFETTSGCSILNIKDGDPIKKKAKSMKFEFEMSSSAPVQLNDYFLSVIPRHPNVNIRCSFCNGDIPSMEAKVYVEQPQARKRYTPICDKCTLC